jgi:hypothetical protein
MDMTRKLGLVRGAVGLLALASLVSACGTEEDGETTTRAGALRVNVPYSGLTAQAGTAGDATLFGNKAYFAFISGGTVWILNDDNLGSNGQDGHATPISGASAQFGPALLALNNTLYLFYVTSSSGSLAMRTTTDGAHWTAASNLATPPEGLWSTPPTAVAWDGKPVVFIASGTSSILSCIFRYDVSGTTATRRNSQNGNGLVCTNTRPSATVWQGALYLAWTDDVANPGQIDIQHWTDAATWSLITNTGKAGIPGIYPLAAGALEMVYRGTDGHIYSTFTSDSTTFTTSVEDTASTTNHAPIPFLNWNLAANFTFYIGVNNQLFTVIE